MVDRNEVLIAILIVAVIFVAWLVAGYDSL